MEDSKGYSPVIDPLLETVRRKYSKSKKIRDAIIISNGFVLKRPTKILNIPPSGAGLPSYASIDIGKC